MVERPELIPVAPSPIPGTGEATQEQFQTPASGPTSPAERVSGSCPCRPACWLLGCASTRVLAGVPAKVTVGLCSFGCGCFTAHLIPVWLLGAVTQLLAVSCVSKHCCL